MPQKNKIKGYDLLLNRKRMLKKRCAELEAQLGDRAHYLKEHYGAMAVNSVFPDGSNKFAVILNKVKDIGLGLFSTGKNDSFLQSAIRSSFKMLIARQAVRLITGRLFGRRKKIR